MKTNRRAIFVNFILLWIASISLSQIHFEPAKSFALPTELGESLSTDYSHILLIAVITLILAFLFIPILRVRRKKKKDEAPHQLYQEPIPTPRVMYLIAFLIFGFLFTMMWLVHNLHEPHHYVNTHINEHFSPGNDGDTLEIPTRDAFPESDSKKTDTLKLFLFILLVVCIASLWRRAHHRYYSWVEPEGNFEGKDGFISSAADKLSLDDPVVRCYQEMCHVLKTKIPYPDEMTPREFAVQCGQAGACPIEVERLTALFESVRYGSRPAEKVEEVESIGLLETIKQLHSKPNPI